MSMDDIQIAEVPARTMHARFYKDGRGSDKIEISFSGSKDTVVHDVTPDLMAEYREEWNAYCDGAPLTQRKGTPLTDVPNVNEDREKHYLHMNVHTAEELAALSDIQCQGVGHGTLTDRKAARQLLMTREADRKANLQKKMEKAMATAQPVKDEQTNSDLSEIKTGIAEMNKNMAALIQALQPRKPGRPPKVKPE